MNKDAMKKITSDMMYDFVMVIPYDDISYNMKYTVDGEEKGPVLFMKQKEQGIKALNIAMKTLKEVSSDWMSFFEEYPKIELFNNYVKDGVEFAFYGVDEKKD